MSRIRLYKKLRRELHQMDYMDVAETLAEWINRSRSYAAGCLAGRNSFKPCEIRTILQELGRPESEASILFPVLGIDIPILPIPRAHAPIIQIHRVEDQNGIDWQDKKSSITRKQAETIFKILMDEIFANI